LKNAIEAVNRNADAYLIKPVNIDELLAIVKEQLGKQEDDKEFNEQKVVEFIESRVKEISMESV